MSHRKGEDPRLTALRGLMVLPPVKPRPVSPEFAQALRDADARTEHPSFSASLVSMIRAGLARIDWRRVRSPK